MLNILLVDATVYKVKLEKSFSKIKSDYLKMKTMSRFSKIREKPSVAKFNFSMGLLHIASVLQNNGYHVQYVHLEDFINATHEIINDFDPSIIAFSCVCPTVPICNKLSFEIKKSNKHVTIAIGGAHLNVAYKTTLQQYCNFDRYVTGYGITAIKNLLKLDSDLNSDHSKYVNYNILPYPVHCYDINLFTTLGCPFNCNYCQDGQMPYTEYKLSGDLHFFKSVFEENVQIHFFDSTLGYSTGRLQEVCKAIQATEHNFSLSCDLRAEFITRKSLKLLEDAGFREIRLGIESADDQILALNKRSVTSSSILDKLQLVRDYSDLYTTVYSVSGLPGSTYDSYQQTKDLFAHMYNLDLIDQIKNSQFVPYPKDNVDYLKQNIIIATNKWEEYDRQSYPVYSTTTLTRDQIWKEFLATAQFINDLWLSEIGFASYDELTNIQEFSNYIAKNYVQ